MRKTVKILLMLAVLVMMLVPAAAFADSYPAEKGDWTVTFDGNDIKSNYEPEEIAKALKGMQPGDEAELEFTLVNDYETEVDWWMENEVIKSFEDESGTAEGGAYTYELRYIGADGSENILYSNNAVGGEQKTREGLHEATDALKEYLYLERIPAGGTAKVVLYFAIDGETQANNYQDTLGRLKLNFAVELPDVKTQIVGRKPGSGPRTGDYTRLMPYVIVAVCAAAVMIAVLILGKRRKESEEA